MKHPERSFASSHTALGLVFCALLAGCSSNKTDKVHSDIKSDGGADAATSAKGTADWTMMGYDVQSTYNNTGETEITRKTAKDLEVLWEKTLDSTSNGTPVVIGNTAYVMTSGTGITAYDATTGEPGWTNEEIFGTASLAYSDGMLYAAVGNDELAQIDAESGKTQWRVRYDDHQWAVAYSSPIPVGDTIVVGGASIEETQAKENATFRGSVAAFDKAGNVLWKQFTVDPPYNGCAVWSTVAVDPIAKLVYAGTGNNYTELSGPTSDTMFAMDLEPPAKDPVDGPYPPGNVKWQKQVTENDVFTIVNPKSPDTDFGANPIVFDAKVDGTMRKLLAAGQKSGDFYVWDRITGDELWHTDLGDGSAFIGGVFINGAWDGEHILVANNNQTAVSPNGDSRGTAVLYALDPATGDTVWKQDLPAWVWGPITVTNGVGFVGYETTMRVFDTSDGSTIKEFKTNGTITGAPAISHGKVFFPSGMSYIFGHPDTGFHVLGFKK